MTWFTLIKFVHVLLAIIAVGFNASYAIWIGRAAADADRGVRTLRTVKFLDDRFANPAYILLLLTGLLMLVVGGIPITTFWILLALILYAVLLVVGLGVYTPTLRNQIGALEAAGPESPEYRDLANRGTLVGILLAVVAVTIVFLMVTKPTLG